MSKSEVRQYLEAYGNGFRHKRKQAGLSQLEVAHIIGCSQAIISHIECGYMLPPSNIERALETIYEEG